MGPAALEIAGLGRLVYAVKSPAVIATIEVDMAIAPGKMNHQGAVVGRIVGFRDNGSGGQSVPAPSPEAEGRLVSSRDGGTRQGHEVSNRAVEIEASAKGVVG